MNDNALLRAALQYAERGLYVFPCRPLTKYPATEHGLLEATTDAEQIKAWWTRTPDANVALSCGPSGIVVLDVDPRHGGDASFEGLRAELGPEVFETKSQSTPSGGTHYLFRASSEPISNSAGKVARGIDVRGVGGYVLVPPSRVAIPATDDSPAVDGKYIWEFGSKDVALLDFPQALREKLGRRQAVFDAADAVIEGGRDNFLTSMAGALRRKGLSASEIYAALAIANRDRCKPPLDDKDVSRIARSVGRYVPADPIGAQVRQSSQPPRSTLGVLSDDELDALATEHVDWLIEGLLREGGIMLLTALPKVGKSELARVLAKALGTGTEFLGRRCRKAKVCWIGLEEPVAHLQERIEVMSLRGLGIQWVVQRPEGDQSAWLREVVQRYRPEVVIIDTISRLMQIEDVKDYSEVARATQIMLDLRSEYGVSWVPIYHNNRQDDGALGSVQWRAFCDTMMLLTRSPEGDRFVRTIQRSGTDMEPARLERDEDTGHITIAESKAMADQRAAEKRILQYALMLGRLATREELARHSGRRNSIGRAAVDGLVTAGFLISRGDGTRSDPRLYEIAHPTQLCADPSHEQNSDSVTTYSSSTCINGEDTRRVRGNASSPGEESPTLSEDSAAGEESEESGPGETDGLTFEEAQDVARAAGLVL